jgi:hypothetical protein
MQLKTFVSFRQMNVMLLGLASFYVIIVQVERMDSGATEI